MYSNYTKNEKPIYQHKVFFEKPTKPIYRP